MDFFALVGGHQQSVFRIEIEQGLQQQLQDVFSGHANSFLSENLHAIPFQRENFSPDESEVLEIAPFDLPTHLFDATSNAIGWPVLPTNDDAISRIYCLFGHEPQQDLLVFQVIPRTQRLTRGGLTLILHGDAFNRLEQSGLILGGECHAVYKAGALRFRSLWWVKQIFDITAYYRAATQADIENFAALGSIKVENTEALTKAGPWVRTRVAYILDSGVLNQFTPQQLSSKAAEFDVALKVEQHNGTEKLVIPQAPKQLRAVLKFLEEEYYAGPITGAAYEANSKRPL